MSISCKILQFYVPVHFFTDSHFTHISFIDPNTYRCFLKFYVGIACVLNGYWYLTVVRIGFTGKHWKDRCWSGVVLYPSSCCCSWNDPWLGSLMSSPGKQGRRGSAVCTRDTLQVTGSTRTSHHAGKSTGRCTLDSYWGKHSCNFNTFP